MAAVKPADPQHNSIVKAPAKDPLEHAGISVCKAGKAASILSITKGT
jgi:hypothetical protein